MDAVAWGEAGFVMSVIWILWSASLAVSGVVRVSDLGGGGEYGVCKVKITAAAVGHKREGPGGGRVCDVKYLDSGTGIEGGAG